MPLWMVCTLLFAIVPGSQSASSSTSQPASPNIAGVWVLNPALTKRPAEIGFSPAWAGAAGEQRESPRPGGGRGRRGSGSSGGSAQTLPQISRESADDSTRVQQLTAEVRTPPAHLTIVQHDSSVSIADDQGLARTFHPDDKQEDLTIGTMALPTTARWESGSLVVVYDVETDRQLRYTYTPLANPMRLLVDVRFIERNREGDDVQLTYERPDEHNEAVVSTAPTAPSVPAAAPSPSSVAKAGAPPAPLPTLPPGSELRGISAVAIEVDDLSAQAAACGLNQSTIKNSVSQVLADAGLKTRTEDKQDAYVVVNIVTSKLQDGACVSRYDTSLVAYADATFPYLRGTVPAVEVRLLHDGGMAGSSPAAHASQIITALTTSVKHFVEQIRGAGK